jgi:NIMA (never in mitosis gene a)-related kinase
MLGNEDAYEVHQLVGRGKFSKVHKGLRKYDGMVCALKFVDLSCADEETRDRSLQEIRFYQSLNHPHIIKYLDSFINRDTRLVIVLEWAGYGDLKRQLSQIKKRGQSLPEATIWKSFLQICSALCFMHKSRILHRDLKPANIFMMKDGRLKIGDLGLSRMLTESAPAAHSTVCFLVFLFHTDFD